MPKWRNISQKNYAKGVDALSQVFDLQDGNVPQLQGMILTTQGAIRTIDGTSLVYSDSTTAGPYRPIFSLGTHDFQGIIPADGSSGGVPFYLIIRGDTNFPLATPTGIVLTSVTATGGVLIPGTTYSYRVSAYDGHGETLASAAVTIVLGAGNNAVQVDWDLMEGATAYTVYGRTAGIEHGIFPVPRSGLGGGQLDSGVTTVSSASTEFIDLGTTAPTTNPPVATTTAEVLTLYKGSSIGGNYGNQPIRRFPNNFTSTTAGGIQPPAKPLRGVWGGATPTFSAFNNNTISGGLIGRSDCFPQFIRMRSQVIIALGNGTPPYSLMYDPSIFDFDAFPLGSSTMEIPPSGQNVPPGMAHGAFINGFLWAINTWPQDENVKNLDGPSALRQSNLNDPTTWNVANSTFINKDDGSEGTGIATFSIAETGIAPQTSVVLFKDFSTFLAPPLLISDPNFAIQQAQTDQGCIAPRSIQFVTGLGIVRLTHIGISAFDGLKDNLLSEPLHPYIFNDIPSNSTFAIDWDYAFLARGFQTVKPFAYSLLCPAIGDRAAYGNGAMTLLLTYDVLKQAWSIVKTDTALGIVLEAASSVRPQGSLPIPLMGGFNDGIVRRWQCNDLVREDTTAIPFSFQTNQVFGQESPSQRLYVRRVYIRGYGPGTLNSAAVQLMGGDTPDPNSPRPTVPTRVASGGNRWTYLKDIGETALDMNVTIGGSGQVEIDAVEWEVSDKPLGPSTNLG